VRPPGVDAARFRLANLACQPISYPGRELRLGVGLRLPRARAARAAGRRRRRHGVPVRAVDGRDLAGAVPGGLFLRADAGRSGHGRLHRSDARQLHQRPDALVLLRRIAAGPRPTASPAASRPPRGAGDDPRGPGAGRAAVVVARDQAVDPAGARPAVARWCGNSRRSSRSGPEFDGRTRACRWRASDASATSSAGCARRPRRACPTCAGASTGSSPSGTSAGRRLHHRGTRGDRGRGDAAEGGRPVARRRDLPVRHLRACARAEAARVGARGVARPCRFRRRPGRQHRSRPRRPAPRSGAARSAGRLHRARERRLRLRRLGHAYSLGQGFPGARDCCWPTTA